MNETITYPELRSAECHALLSSGRRRYWHWKQLLGFCRLAKPEDLRKRGDFLVSKVAIREDGLIVFQDFEVIRDWIMLPCDLVAHSRGLRDYYLVDGCESLHGGYICDYGDATILKFNRPIEEVAAILSNMDDRYRRRKLQEMGKEFKKDVD